MHWPFCAVVSLPVSFVASISRAGVNGKGCKGRGMGLKRRKREGLAFAYCLLFLVSFVLGIGIAWLTKGGRCALFVWFSVF